MTKCVTQNDFRCPLNLGDVHATGPQSTINDLPVNSTGQRMTPTEGIPVN